MRAGFGFCRKNSSASGSSAGQNITPWLLASAGEAGMPAISTSASGKRGRAFSSRMSTSPHATTTR